MMKQQNKNLSRKINQQQQENFLSAILPVCFSY